jgi:hypothetical protein
MVNLEDFLNDEARKHLTQLLKEIGVIITNEEGKERIQEGHFFNVSGSVYRHLKTSLEMLGITNRETYHVIDGRKRSCILIETSSSLFPSEGYRTEVVYIRNTG